LIEGERVKRWDLEPDILEILVNVYHKYTFYERMARPPAANNSKANFIGALTISIGPMLNVKSVRNG